MLRSPSPSNSNPIRGSVPPSRVIINYMSSTTLQPLAMIYPSIPVLEQRPEPPQLVLPGNYVSRWGLVSGRLAPTRHAASVTLEGQSGIIRHHTAKWIQTRFLSPATGRFFQFRPHATFVAHETDRLLSKYFRDMNIVDSNIRARVDQSIKPHVTDDSSQPGSNQSPIGSLDTLHRQSPQHEALSVKSEAPLSEIVV